MRFDLNPRPTLSTVDCSDSRVSSDDQAPLRRPERVDTMASTHHEPKRHDTFNTIDTYTTPTPSTSTMNKPQASQRPKNLTRVPSVQTRYMEMLLHLDKIPRLHNILAAAFTWILLAGFLVIPGTFTSFKNSEAFKSADSNDSNAVAEAIIHSVANIGLVWVSGACCIIGALGCFYLFFRWRHNYVWLINRIFFPATLNSVAGLLTTVVNVYTAQKGVWSVTAKVTAIVTGSCIGVAGGLFALYNFWILEKVRDTHERAFVPEDEPRNKRETMVEKVKRKAHEPALEPGSVV